MKKKKDSKSENRVHYAGMKPDEDYFNKARNAIAYKWKILAVSIFTINAIGALIVLMVVEFL